jgi:V8-like Glu-specific endopeptidase
MRTAIIVSVVLLVGCPLIPSFPHQSFIDETAKNTEARNPDAAALFREITPAPSRFNRELVARIERELDNRQLRKDLQSYGYVPSVPEDLVFRNVESQTLISVRDVCVIYPDEDNDPTNDDGREEVFPDEVVRTAAEKRNIAAVAAIVPITNFRQPASPWKLNDGIPLLLCKKEKFEHQRSAAECTGFLVGNSLVMTAHHCVAKYRDFLDDVRFVFGFHVLQGKERVEFADEEVFKPKAIVARDVYLDYAIIELERPVKHYQQLPRRKVATKICDKDAVYAIGCPSGLPVKIARGANVLTNDRQEFFYTTLDTFVYNSGSPVFNAETDELEGIVVAGVAGDYVEVNGCRIPRRCDTTCDGQKVARITEMAVPEKASRPPS